MWCLICKWGLRMRLTKVQSILRVRERPDTEWGGRAAPSPSSSNRQLALCFSLMRWCFICREEKGRAECLVNMLALILGYSKCPVGQSLPAFHGKESQTLDWSQAWCPAPQKTLTVGRWHPEVHSTMWDSWGLYHQWMRPWTCCKLS